MKAYLIVSELILKLPKEKQLNDFKRWEKILKRKNWSLVGADDSSDSYSTIKLKEKVNV